MTPTKKELRNFGFTMAIAIAVMFGILLPLLFNNSFKAWPWIISTIFLILALIGTPLLRYIHKAWMSFGYVMGAINSRILLTIFFFLVITPIGLLLRLFGKNPLSLKLNKQEYRTISSEPTSLKLPF